MNVWRMQIYGLVQGVGFRYSLKRFVAQNAQSLIGFVRNRSDGSVEVVASGELAHLQELYRFVQVGPPSAEVERVEVDYNYSEGAQLLGKEFRVWQS